jgi:hypothetical protein
VTRNLIFPLVLLLGTFATEVFAQAPGIPNGRFAVAVADSVVWTQGAPTFSGRYAVSAGWTLDNIEIKFEYFTANGLVPFSTTTTTASLNANGINFSNGFATAAPAGATRMLVKVTLNVWQNQMVRGEMVRKDVPEAYLFPAAGSYYTVGVNVP